MTTFSFKDLVSVNDKFRHYFGVEYKRFDDRKMGFIANRIMIDLFKFEDYLREKYNYDEDQHVSLNDFITTKFSEEACNFLISLL